LLHIAHAGNGFGILLGRVQDGQQHGRQNGNDGNDHQQLNQGKGILSRLISFHIHPAKSIICFRLNYFPGRATFGRSTRPGNEK
jgi:hypothetical protein